MMERGIMPQITAERKRLQAQYADQAQWYQWGPYLSERAWGTVREDYSATGQAWDYFPHDHARSRAYRWNEDGMLGISDRKQYLCFAPAFWNGADAILKERFFGLTGPQGNHGEDVKEYYFYVDNVPTHSYMKAVYKYPQRAFPYADLVNENARRGLHEFEYELLDTGIFDDDRYFDIVVEYAKQSPDDVLIRITATNRGPDAAPLTFAPALWFRNTWSWGYESGPMQDVPTKPALHSVNGNQVKIEHPNLAAYQLDVDGPAQLLFTENETNHERIHGLASASPYVKDAFHRYIVDGEQNAVNPQQIGTKVGVYAVREVEGGASVTMRLRLTATSEATDNPFADFDDVFSARIMEADEFYAEVQPDDLTEDERNVQRQAYAGMLWTKQLYYYDIEQWLAGDPGQPAPPASRKQGRNHEWRHLNNFAIISMPDKWEYPWYAGWDLAFHCIPLARLDPEFAKEQLILLSREGYIHPNGQLPAYEWAFGDVNPPVHAWATFRVYQIDAEMTGKPDVLFLERVYNKMLLNFTWWVNRKDAEGRNIFQGGFLGLDNISLFDRSAQLPVGGTLDQSDGTAWMGFYCMVMMNIALELTKTDMSYQDMAIKFHEHFLWIADAVSGAAKDGVGLWDEQDGFYYDVLRLPDGKPVPLRVRSLVGLMPLLAVETVGQTTLERVPGFRDSVNWLKQHRPYLAENLSVMLVPNYGNALLFALPKKERLLSVLRYMLDEDEFLSPYGVRSLSKVHEDPYSINIGGQHFAIEYWPAESRSGLFGGNSNWRGPIWFPINYLLIESLRIFHRFYRDDLKVECPTGSGVMMTLNEVADELDRRLRRIFINDEAQHRPLYGGLERFQEDPHWHNLILFHEYFHGDNGAGLGASHQTGWSGLIADMIHQLHQPESYNRSIKMDEKSNQ